MHDELLTKIRYHQPRAFLMGSGEIFCRLRELPTELAGEVAAHNDRVCPSRGDRVNTSPHRGTSAVAATAAPRNGRAPAWHPNKALWEACLAQGGPSLDDADELAQEIGLEAAVALVRECGRDAPMTALTTRVYGGGVRMPV